MTGKESKRLSTMRRRRDFLRQRIDTFDPDYDPSFDRAEFAALDWAVEIISRAAERGVLTELSREET